MRRSVLAIVTTLLVCLAPTYSAADVKTKERTLVKFGGALGRIIGIFGGEAAREGIVSTVAVKGDRKMTLSDYGGQLIDLTEEKIYDLDVRGKRYTVMTFAEYRKQLEQALADARRSSEQSRAEAEGARKGEAQVELDVDVKETGQRKAIAGYDTRQVILTIAVREKGKTLEESGGLVLTADMWLAEAAPALAEIQAFDRRYLEKLHSSLAAGLDARQMAAAFALYPTMQQAFARLQRESGSLKGVALATTLTFDAVKSQQQLAEESERSQQAGGGGIGGMLARRLMRRKPEEQSARATVFTSTHEVLAITGSATDADVAIPAGFTEKR